MVVVRQMGLQKTEHGQRDGACRKERVNGGKPTREAGCLDAAARFVLTEAELGQAIAEERREPLFDMKAASVDLTQMKEEVCRDAPMGADDDVEPMKQCIVGHAGESLHDQRLPW